MFDAFFIYIQGKIEIQHTPKVSTVSCLKIDTLLCVVTGVQCFPQRAALLKSMLNFLKKAIPDGAFAESIRHCEWWALSTRDTVQNLSHHDLCTVTCNKRNNDKSELLSNSTAEALFLQQPKKLHSEMCGNIVIKAHNIWLKCQRKTERMHLCEGV